MVFVSIILPFYNSREFLNDSIQSMLNQTFTNFELILLDDGSTDKPLEVIKKFKDKRIIYKRENQNKGIIFQLNKGISLSRGSYIARMDADDISFPQRLQRQVEFLENSDHREISVLGTDAVQFGTENKEIIHKNYHPQQISFLLNFTCPILHPTVMFRSSVFSKGLRYPEIYMYAEDFALWRIIDNGRNIAILDEVLLKYRIHNYQTNKDSERLRIQSDSVSRSLLNSKKFDFVEFCFLIFGKDKLIRKSVELWYGSTSNVEINFLARLIIRFYKKRLKIKSQLLTNLISN